MIDSLVDPPLQVQLLVLVHQLIQAWESVATARLRVPTDSSQRLNECAVIWESSRNEKVNAPAALRAVVNTADVLGL